MKRLFVTFFLVLLSVVVESHEFWLLPKKFRYKPGESMVVDFMVGENFEGEYWDLNKHKVVKLDLWQGAEVKSLLKEVKNTAGKNLTATLAREGTYILGLESNAAFIELDGGKFKAYLEEDGLENILELRTRANRHTEPAREFYKRFAKVLIQAGDKTDETYRRRMGYRYEIIPLKNPYAMKSGDYLQCRVLWEGKPAPHAMVKVWSKLNRSSFLQNMYTEDDGTVTFPLSHSGPWMVSAVRMIPSEDPGADYQSFWASVVFEIE